MCPLVTTTPTPAGPSRPRVEPSQRSPKSTGGRLTGSSRSPKRARQTPPPVPADVPLSSTPTPNTRRSHLAKRGTPSSAADKGKHAQTGQCTVEAEHLGGRDRWGLPIRRREMSVPLLSQTLSHFSLSQTSPISPMMSRHFLVSPGRRSSPSALLEQPSPPNHSFTPRRLPSYLHRDEGSYGQFSVPHPSTAPLPHVASFLGSPFSSKVDRGRYCYQSMSPTRPQTERLNCGNLQDQGLEWLDSSEWMVDEALVASDSDDEELSVRPRRETSGSSSSIDDFSGSDTSTTSLSSLNRNSGDAHRPHIVTGWSDPSLADVDNDEDPVTPSRQLFAGSDLVDGVLHMSTKTSRNESAGSPVPSRWTPSSLSRSPLQHFLRSRSSQVTPISDQASLTAKSKKSPLSVLLPRLLSSTKRDMRTCENSKSLPQGDDNEVERMTDTEGSDTSSASALAARKSHVAKPRTMSDATDSGLPIAGGIGLGISGTGGRSFSGSLRGKPSPPQATSSSDSSTEINNSPSRFVSLRTSTTRLSTSGRLSAPAAHIVRSRSNSGLMAPSGHSFRTGKLNGRPQLRRGITEPRTYQDPRHLSPGAGVQTPVHLFADVKPSPAAFASTGLVKKRSGIASITIPTFSDKLKDASDSPISPLKPLSSFPHSLHLDLVPGSDASLNYVKAAQKARGLRRKGSQMFASGSSGSVSENSGTVVPTSPTTPTKPSLGLVSFSSIINTPSPPGPGELHQPVPSTSTQLGTPAYDDAHLASDDTLESSPCNPKVTALRRGPVVRLSNPMLAADYKAHAKTPAQTASLHAMHRGATPAGRLERDFMILSSLGRGEFSQVWQVKEKSTGKLFAVKAGKPYTGSKNRLRQLEEVSILRSLTLRTHKGIVAFHDSWEARGRLYIRTELLPCGDLARFLQSLGDLGGLGEARTWKTLVELSSAIEHVHDSGFLHLDVKPSNILLTSDGHLKLADFGMSTIIDDAGRVGGLSPALPQTVEDGAFVWEGSSQELVPSPIIDRELEGDREYLSPEALAGSVGKEADVFSLGILLLEAVMNVVLPSNGDAWIKLRNDDFSDLDEHHLIRQTTEIKVNGMEDSELPQISEALMGTIRGMMKRVPEERMTLREVTESKVVQRVTRAMQDGRVGAALAKEDKKFISEVLHEEEA
ncbi:hypothetical protein BCR39DRAFT_511438 [Naematelia encephala]|uniref:Protein kinase domain-containing protein n=1 Tax=Naematelia encephala TaxID=71784 RepID=A0A1Y2BLM2_9TREE|nr:hypothetical protein BCR39DRAFT_511438 [Naematelia encephala]